MSAGGNPLIAEIPLPEAAAQSLGEFKRALSFVKKELAELERDAKSLLLTTGQTDPTIADNIQRLRGVQSSLQNQHDLYQIKAHSVLLQEGIQKRLADEEMMGERRLGFAQYALSHTIPGAAQGIGLAQQAKHLFLEPTRVANWFEKMGWSRAAAAVQPTAAAALSAFRTIGGAIASPVGVSSLAVAGLGLAAMHQNTEAAAATGNALQQQANAFLSAFPQSPFVGTTQAAGAAYHHRMLQKAAEEGSATAVSSAYSRLSGAVGWAFGGVAKSLGLTSLAAALEPPAMREEEATNRVARLNAMQAHLAAKKDFGIDYDMYNASALRKAAERDWRRKTLTNNGWFNSDPLAAVGLGLGAVWAGAQGLFGVGALENAQRYIERAKWQVFTDRAMKDPEQEKTRRASEQFMWQNGLQGAVNAMIAQEARRHLNAVETDRLARFNSWGMQ